MGSNGTPTIRSLSRSIGFIDHAKRLIWLNPLLRFHAFEARAKGVQTMLPHVDELRPIHNLDSMNELVRALSGAPAKGYDPKDAEAGCVTEDIDAFAR